MKKSYDTFKQEEKWPKMTILTRNPHKRTLLYIGYILSLGVLYILCKWLKSFHTWPYSESDDGTYVLIEEANESFEIKKITEMEINESSLKFSKTKSTIKIQVIFYIDLYA